jgi:hypothetical protein
VTEIKDFNLKCFLDTAEELLRADETIRALWILDNLPGYYRDHVPPEVSKLKREIMKHVATSSFYANSGDYELSANAEETYKLMENTLRGSLLLEDVKKSNSHKHKPYIFDMGPGEYWMPRMLNLKECEFYYKAIHVNSPSFECFKKALSR